MPTSSTSSPPSYSMGLTPEYVTKIGAFEAKASSDNNRGNDVFVHEA